MTRQASRSAAPPRPALRSCRAVGVRRAPASGGTGAPAARPRASREPPRLPKAPARRSASRRGPPGGRRTAEADERCLAAGREQVWPRTGSDRPAPPGGRGVAGGPDSLSSGRRVASSAWATASASGLRRGYARATPCVTCRGPTKTRPKQSLGVNEALEKFLWYQIDDQVIRIQDDRHWFFFPFSKVYVLFSFSKT